MPEALSHDIVAAAIHLTAPIRAARDELDAGRRLPPSLVEALANAGWRRGHASLMIIS